MSRSGPELARDSRSGWPTSSRREQILSDVSRALLSSLDADALLRALINVLVPELAGACYVELLPENAALVAPSAATELGQAGTSAVAVAPIRALGRVIGTLTLIAASSEHDFAEFDAEWLNELGRRTGSALANAELYRAAQAAARNAESASRVKDEFLATACHELRAPLNVINAWLSLLAREQLTDRARKAIDVVERNARSQERLIDDILDLSRVGCGKLRLDLAPVDLSNVLRDAVEAMASTAASRRITITVTTSNAAREIMGDSERLRQVIFNLLSNAIKFSNIGGRIRVSLDERDEFIALTVIDEGRGIAPEFLPHVFDRLSQANTAASRRSDGLGIGLSLVRDIVELHGGSVQATSPGVGLGTTVNVRLPFRPRPTSSA